MKADLAIQKILQIQTVVTICNNTAQPRTLKCRCMYFRKISFVMAGLIAIAKSFGNPKKERDGKKGRDGKKPKQNPTCA